MNSTTDIEKIQASVLIIGQNCEPLLARCLNSVIDFAEVVFVDGGSTDNTKAIATSYANVNFVSNPWPGFIKQRNVSIDNAHYPWCFMIDSDEAATPELIDAIREVVQKKPDKVMYRVVRTEYFEGHPIESGHGKSDYQERLFKRDRIRYTGGNHHKHLVDGRPIEDHPELVEDFPPHIRVLHNPEYGLDDMIEKFPRFAIMIGNEKFQSGRRVSIFDIFITFIWTSLRMIWKSRKNKNTGVVIAFMKAFNDTMAKLYVYNLEKVRKRKQLKDYEAKSLG